MASVKVNIGTDGTVGVAPDEDTGCECNRESWPLIILLLGFGNCFFICLVGVLSLIQLSNVVLSSYIIVLAVVALMAEMRRVKFLRGIFYHPLKFVYFLTNYYCRGFFYIFIGSILLADAPLNIIAGSLSMAFGVLLMVLHTWFGLPNYPDWQVVKEEKERAAARAAAGLPGTTPFAGAAYSPAATPTADNHGYVSNAYVTGGGSAAPPASNPAYDAPASTAVGTGAYVAPAANTAYMGAGVEDPYDEEPITSAPASRARQNNDDALAAAYYAQQQAASQQQQTRAARIDNDDPFARDDSQYRPNRQ